MPSPPSGIKNTFSGWVVAESVYTKNAAGKSVLLNAGTLYDFSQPVYGDLKLKSTWTHVHEYKLQRIKDLVGEGYEEYDEVLHVAVCDCGDLKYEAHDFGRKCGCGYEEPKGKIKIYIYFSDSAEPIVQEIEQGTQYMLFAPAQYTTDNGTGLFAKLQICKHAKTPDWTKSIQEISQRVGVISASCDIDVHADYKDLITEPLVSLQSTRRDNNILYYRAEWRLPQNWQILSAGIKIANNNRLRYWENNTSGMRQPWVIETELMGPYTKYDIMEHMMLNWGLTANKQGKDFQADVISITSSNPKQKSSVSVEYTIHDKNEWQYVLGYVEVLNPKGEKYLYYTDPIQMRYKKENECNRTVKYTDGNNPNVTVTEVE